MVEADLSHLIIGASALGNVQLAEVHALQSFVDGGPTVGSDKRVFAQINLLHVHLVEADLSHSLIGEDAGGDV